MKTLNKKGFTLIEVVLVLAIGGLIFLLAFIAYQQVSTNRKDTQRRNDAGRILAQIQSAQGDGFKITSQTALGPVQAGGVDADSGFVKTQFGGSLETPVKTKYKWTYVNGSPSPTAVVVDAVFVSAVGWTCNQSDPTKLVAKDGSVAVIVGLEKGGAICRSE